MKTFEITMRIFSIAMSFIGLGGWIVLSPIGKEAMGSWTILVGAGIGWMFGRVLALEFKDFLRERYEHLT